MKRILCIEILLIVGCYILISYQPCLTREPVVTLPSPVKKQVYSVLVNDASEAAFLEHQLKLEIVKMKGVRLYFYDNNNKLGEELKELGYQQINHEVQPQVYKQYARQQLPKHIDTIYNDLAASLNR